MNEKENLNKVIKETIKTKLGAPLQCWDVIAIHFDKIGSIQVEHGILDQYRKKFKWNINLEKILDTAYDALILTDKNIVIRWVDDGFTVMTGYQQTEVLGRSPKLLHGPNTTTQSSLFIRQKLNQQKAFDTKVINYRKSGEEYLCGLKIHPILDSSNILTHYLALENRLD